MIEYIIATLLVIIISPLILVGWFLWGVHYGYIERTPELEEFLNKIKFWQDK